MINTGVNTSKLVGFAALTVPDGVDASKVVGFAALTPPVGVDVSKLVAHAVIGAQNSTPPLWGAWTFPDGTQYISYDYSWDMSTSATVVAYSVVAGAIPTGLSLTALTGNQAHIHGVPLALGLFSFTLRATNTFGTVDKAFSITINPIPSSVGGNFGFVA